MGAAAIADLAAELIMRLVPIGAQALQAEHAGDQATLDNLKNTVVSMSNALAPPGAEVVAVD